MTEQSCLSKLTGDTTGRSVWYTRGLCRHLERSCCAEKWAKRNLMDLDMCEVLHLGRNNAGTSTSWSLSGLKAVSWSFAEKDFGVLMNNKLTRYHQCALRPMASWTALGRALLGGQGRGLFLSTQHWRGYSWLCPVLEFQVERYGATGVSSS